MSRGLIATAVAATLIVGCRRSSRPHTSEQVPEPLSETTAQAAEPELPTGYIGVLMPKAQADVVAPFTTSVKRYLVGVGDHVTAGTPLADLDDQPIRQQIETTSADLKGAMSAQGQASNDYAQAERMFNARIGSKAAITTAAFELRSAGAKVERAKADAEAAKAKLAKATLVAPIDGTVSLQFVRAGAQVTDGNVVVRVIDSGDLFVRFAVPTGEASRVKVNMPIDLSIESNGQSIPARATVTHIPPDLDPVSRMIFADAELTNQPATLQAGLLCRVKVP